MKKLLPHLLLALISSSLFSQYKHGENEVIVQRYDEGEKKLVVTYKGKGADEKVVKKAWYFQNSSIEKEISFNNGDTLIYKIYTEDYGCCIDSLIYKDNKKWDGYIGSINESKLYEMMQYTDLKSKLEFYKKKYVRGVITYEDGKIINQNELIYFNSIIEESNINVLYSSNIDLFNGKFNGRYFIIDSEEDTVFIVEFEEGEYKKYTRLKGKEILQDDGESTSHFSTSQFAKPRDARTNINIGFFDNRIPLSFVGISYDLKQTEKNEFYLGLGALGINKSKKFNRSISIISLTSGWKHYFFKNYSLYSTISFTNLFNPIKKNQIFYSAFSLGAEIGSKLIFSIGINSLYLYNDMGSLLFIKMDIPLY